jgi:hypothetical protein
VKEAKWAAALLDDEPALAPATDAMPEGTELASILSSLEELDRFDRDVLLARFGSPETSERVLASQAGLSPYRFRERVALALMRLAGLMGERGAATPATLAVARRVFVEGTSITCTAAELGMTEPQVRAVRRRILDALGKASIEASL